MGIHNPDYPLNPQSEESETVPSKFKEGDQVNWGLSDEVFTVTALCEPDALGRIVIVDHGGQWYLANEVNCTLIEPTYYEPAWFDSGRFTSEAAIVENFPSATHIIAKHPDGSITGKEIKR